MHGQAQYGSHLKKKENEMQYNFICLSFFPVLDHLHEMRKRKHQIVN